MAYTQIEYSISSRIARITINRPERRNALTSTVIEELTKAFTVVGSDPDIRCVLLSGSGTEAFCAGADLSELQTRPDVSARRAFFVSIAKLVSTVRECPVPVVCAVRGFALAGGLGLVGASDIAVAADDAVFGLPEVAIGLAPMVVMAPLSATLSPRMLSYLAITGDRISASEALAAGLLTRVVKKDELSKNVDALCESVCHRGPEAVRATKVALRDIPLSDRTTFIYELADRSALVSLSAEASEGIAAQLEKRPPSWRS